MGIQRWDCRAEENEGGGLFVNDFECDGGRYVLFSDHERVLKLLQGVIGDFSRDIHQLNKCPADQFEITRLRAELAAKSKDAARYVWLRDHAPEAWDVTRWLDNEHQEIHVQDYLDEAIDSAMGEGNE